MNSSLTFKKTARILFALLSLTLISVYLCSCSSKAVYRIDSISWVSEEVPSVTTTYTYTEDNKPETVSVVYHYGYAQSYTDTYSYDKKGNMVACSRSYDGMVKEEYTAKKITKNKYILYDDEQKEYLTLIFDDSGFIVSYRYTTGYVNEYAFTNDENGKPIAFKTLDVRPSGSNRVIDYTVEFKDGETFRMYATGEFENKNEYYEVKYQKIKVKG